MGYSSSAIVVTFSVFLLSISLASSNTINENFLQCLSSETSTSISQVVYTPTNSSYSPILDSPIQNLRFLSPTTPKPQFILTALNESHVQAAVVCCRKHGLEIRTRSGGHDYEGLSYRSDVPFIIVDLANLRSISVDIEDSSAWVQSGATVGEVYYQIAEKSNTHGFPAANFHTVGIGGHFSGGGHGFMVRKYGLAADHVIDARLVNANGTILDRESMGEDLFWAIRGGGGGSFGIVLSWKIRLVAVPATVTVFTIAKTLEQDATKLIHKWQYVADKVHEDLFIRVVITVVNATGNGERTLSASFLSLFLGDVDRLLLLMNESFPELGLERKDCTEMSWIQSTLYFAGLPTDGPSSAIQDRNQTKGFFKAKSDYVKTPISQIGLEGIWRRLLEEEGSIMILSPYGGRMSEISESEIPFPHRAGNIYNIQHMVTWVEGRNTESQRYINWIRQLYRDVAPYVSKHPRAAYINYRDLDLGSNKGRNTTYTQALVWGRKYLKNNFKRLAQVKSQVDPDNFFWHEQSIPPFSSLPWK